MKIYKYVIVNGRGEYQRAEDDSYSKDIRKADLFETKDDAEFDRQLGDTIKKLTFILQEKK
jgi:hypothetical protein